MKPKKKTFPRARVYVCPHCGKAYAMGYNGTIKGCDTCTNITRDKMGMIIKEKNNEILGI